VAISFFQTAAWNTNGTLSGTVVYKDVVLTGVASGDLIVVFGASENYGGGGGTRAIATQAGATTGAWTLSSPATTSGADVDAIGGWALATSSGTVTVRVSLRQNSAMHMGVGAWLIPVADIGSTYGWLSPFAADADGQISVTLSGSSFLAYGAGDWAAASIASTASTPVASNYRVRVVDSGAYSAYLVDWLAQASGTRNYGPSGLSGDDFSGVIFRMDSAGGATNYNGTATLAGTGSITASGVVGKASTATLAGTGAISATGSVTSGLSGSATLAGTGAISATGVVGKAATATLAGTGAISATGVVGKAATATLAGTGAITATGTAGTSGALTGTATLAGTGTITATGVKGLRPAATLAGTGAIAASGAVGGTGTAIDNPLYLSGRAMF
jgi:hypothetical protein